MKTEEIESVVSKWDRYGLLQYCDNKYNAALAMEYIALFIAEDSLHSDSVRNLGAGIYPAVVRVFDNNFKENLPPDEIKTKVAVVLRSIIKSAPNLVAQLKEGTMHASIDYEAEVIGIISKDFKF
jgi:hypothetical protein